MTRIVIHAGFHKTGTSSVQDMLRANRALLETEVRLALREDILPLASITGSYPLNDGADRLTKVYRRALGLFRTCDTEDPRTLVISCEDLAGTIPGRVGVVGYTGTTQLLERITRAAVTRFGKRVDLIFFFSTRNENAWLKSAWWQNLRSSRLTEDFDTFSDRLRPAANFEATLQAVAKAVEPAKVTSLSLEECQVYRHGPLEPLLELSRVSPSLRDALAQRAPANVQPDLGLAEVFLALNRSGVSDKHLQKMKRSLLGIATKSSVSKPE